MSKFTVHNQETAPAGSVELLDSAEKAFGFLPNLLGMMSESPATLNAYMMLGKLFDQSSFNATERQTIILAISRYNECQYCVAAHSMVAGMQNVPREVIEAIRNDEVIADSRLQILREIATQAVENRGRFSDADISRFLDAGFSKAQLLEVILAASYKTLSNYINHIAKTPLDDVIVSESWEPVRS